MTNTIDKKEIEQFSLISNKWWDQKGPFAALHKMSNVRIEFILLRHAHMYPKAVLGLRWDRQPSTRLIVRAAGT